MPRFRLLQDEVALGLKQSDFKSTTSASINLCLAFKRIVSLEILTCVPI